MVRKTTPVHNTTLPTKDLANLFVRLKQDMYPQQRIASYLNVTTQKITAICKHASK